MRTAAPTAQAGRPGRPGRPARPLPDATDVAIVGGGFGGLGTAIRLLQSGRPDFVVLERADDLGGTWRDNSYPGCACDVPSHLYSFSFAPNPDWSRSFSGQPEIRDYLRRTADRFGLRPHLYYRAEVLEARWDGAAGRWQLQTARGSLTARVLVVACGPLSEPSVPALPGLDRFGGVWFHSATWRHDHDLAGERVAVVGTGASAIQFVPVIAEQAGRVTVFQRTAPWVLPRRDRKIRPAERWAYRHLPRAQALARCGSYGLREVSLLAFTGHPALRRRAEQVALRFLRGQVADPALRERLTPRFQLGCKRVLLSNDYYPALTRPQVDVVTDRIVEVTAGGLVTLARDGSRTEHPAGTIIFGTGFHVTDPPVAARIAGRDGRTLAEHWAGGMAALHGLTVAGFPNMFFLVGPNTGLGHTSIIYMIESQLRYVLDALRQMDERGIAAIEPLPEAQDRYNAWVQDKLAGTVWNTGGCASWYLDAQGRNSTLWPTFTFRYRRRTRRCDLADYRVRAVPAGRPAPAPVAG
jgi:cation diffusion facilitator CzcD-associated flavoprotein CzcO